MDSPIDNEDTTTKQRATDGIFPTALIPPNVIISPPQQNGEVFLDPIASEEIKEYAKNYIWPYKKWFKDQDQLDDLQLVTSVGRIMIRAFKIDLKPEDYQKDWWDAVKENLVLTPLRNLRNNASRDISKYITYGAYAKTVVKQTTNT